MKNSILIILLSILAFSCSNSTIFERKHRFENNNWFRFNELIYEVDVEAGEKYAFDGIIITDSTFKSRKMELGFYLYLPDGGKRLEDQSIRILDYEYQQLGKKTEMGFELPVSFREELIINETGKLKIKITNHSQYVDNYGIIGIDLIIRKL